MSSHRLSKAFELHCSPTAKLLAIYLADQAAPDSESQKFSIKKIANFVGIHRSDVTKFLADLVFIGELSSFEQEGPDVVRCYFSWFVERHTSSYPRKKAISKKMRSAVFERDGHTCVYCGCDEGPFHADHVIPESRGGETNESNLVCACAKCNISKRDKTPEEWGRT